MTEPKQQTICPQCKAPFNIPQTGLTMTCAFCGFQVAVPDVDERREEEAALREEEREREEAEQERKERAEEERAQQALRHREKSSFFSIIEVKLFLRRRPGRGDLRDVR
jgi:uncharacterized Zn finger protein (UPF0148 family)